MVLRALRRSSDEFPATAAETCLPVGRCAEPAAIVEERPDAVPHPVMTDREARQTIQGPPVPAVSELTALVRPTATDRAVGLIDCHWLPPCAHRHPGEAGHQVDRRAVLRPLLPLHLPT